MDGPGEAGAATGAGAASLGAGAASLGAGAASLAGGGARAAFEEADLASYDGKCQNDSNKVSIYLSSSKNERSIHPSVLGLLLLPPPLLLALPVGILT